MHCVRPGRVIDVHNACARWREGGGYLMTAQCDYCTVWKFPADPDENYRCAEARGYPSLSAHKGGCIIITLSTIPDTAEASKSMAAQPFQGIEQHHTL